MIVDRQIPSRNPLFVTYVVVSDPAFMIQSLTSVDPPDNACVKSVVGVLHPDCALYNDVATNYQAVHMERKLAITG